MNDLISEKPFRTGEKFPEPVKRKPLDLGDGVLLYAHSVFSWDCDRCHFELRLYVPESGMCFLLFAGHYEDPWVIRKRKMEKLEREMDEEDEREMNEIDIIQKYGYDVYDELRRKGAL